MKSKSQSDHLDLRLLAKKSQANFNNYVALLKQSV